MKIAKAIRTMIINKELQHNFVVDKLGYTKQGFSLLLKKDNFKLSDIIKIADIIGYDVQLKFIDRDGNNDITLG